MREIRKKNERKNAAECLLKFDLRPCLPQPWPLAHRNWNFTESRNPLPNYTEQSESAPATTVVSVDIALRHNYRRRYSSRGYHQKRSDVACVPSGARKWTPTGTGEIVAADPAKTIRWPIENGRAKSFAVPTAPKALRRSLSSAALR